MRYIVLAITVAMLPSAGAAAEQLNQQKAATSSTPAPKGVRTGNPCAEYGAGFVRVEGTATCVKIGGSVGVGVGSTVPR